MIGMHMSSTPWGALENTLKRAKAGAYRILFVRFDRGVATGMPRS